MSFRLVHSESFIQGIQRIVNEQIDLASEELDRRPPDPITVPHQVRKRCKKIRALIRLAKTGMKNRKTYQQENRRLRDAARMMSDIRDAQVMINTYDHVMALQRPDIDRRTFGPIRRRLSSRFESVCHDEASLKRSFREIQATLAKSRECISDALVDDCHETVMYEGLNTTYAKAHQAMSDVFTRPTDEGFHEWRKHVKYHWYHCRLLVGVWNPVLSGRASELHRLEEYLGEDHDLGVFERSLPESREVPHSSDGVPDMLIRVIHQRKQMLRTAIRPFGCRLFVESPKDFSTRICAYWKVWTRETPKAQEV
ncbi:MAG: CHAD domain-containing protein [Nitrospirales bacterium]|nr:MAG: CHAD domain-containing protein [Nitrospirales bacterium]